jgi:hypothetical protein
MVSRSPSGRGPNKGGFRRFRSKISFETPVTPLDDAELLVPFADADDAVADDAFGEDTQAIDAVAAVADQPDPDASADTALDEGADSQSEALAAEDAAADDFGAADDDGAVDAATGDEAQPIDVAVAATPDQLDTDADPGLDALDDAADVSLADALADDLAAIDLEYPELELLTEVEPDLWFEAGALDDAPAAPADDLEYQVITHEEQPGDTETASVGAEETPDDAPAAGPNLSSGVEVVRRRNQYIRRSWNPEKPPEPDPPAFTMLVDRRYTLARQIIAGMPLPMPKTIVVQRQIAVIPPKLRPMRTAAMRRREIEEDDDEALAAMLML